MENNINVNVHVQDPNGRGPEKKDRTVLVALIQAFATIAAVIIPILLINRAVTGPSETKPTTDTVETPQKPGDAAPTKSVKEEFPVSSAKLTTPASIEYFNKGLLVEVAFLENKNTQIADVIKHIESLFSKNGIKTSNQYFREAFRKRINQSIKNIDLDEIKSIGLPDGLNCICQIIEDTKIEDQIMEGRNIKVARTSLQIHLLNLKTGNIDNIQVPMSGSGISEAMALESLEEHLLASDKLNALNLKQCK